MEETTSAPKNSADQVLEARRLGAKGFAHIEAKQMDDAYRCFVRVYEIAQEIDDRGLQSDALGSMGMVQIEIGDPAMAIEKFNEGLLIAQELEDRRREMAHFGSLGNVYLNIAAGEDASRFFSYAYEIAVELEDKQAQAGYLGNLAAIEYVGRQNEKAAELFERVRALTREIGDAVGERNALRHLITIYADNSMKQDLVFVYLRRAIALSRRLNDYPAEASYQDALILALLSLNRYQDSLLLIAEALEDERLSSLPERKLHLLVNQGNAYYDGSLLDEAYDAYHQALNYSVRRQDWQVEARMLGRLGAVEAERGNLEAAVSYAQKAIEKAERVEDARLIGEQYCMLALAHRDMGDRAGAIANAQKAVAVLDKVAVPPLQEKALDLLEELRYEP